MYLLVIVYLPPFPIISFGFPNRLLIRNVSWLPDLKDAYEKFIMEGVSLPVRLFRRIGTINAQVYVFQLI